MISNTNHVVFDTAMFLFSFSFFFSKFGKRKKNPKRMEATVSLSIIIMIYFFTHQLYCLNL